jgi:hypothetical protein
MPVKLGDKVAVVNTSKTGEVTAISSGIDLVIIAWSDGWHSFFRHDDVRALLDRGILRRRAVGSLSKAGHG